MRAIPTRAGRWLTPALCLIAISTGCAPKEEAPRIVVKVERVEVKHPDGLLACKEEPLPPPPGSTGQQGLDWVAELRAVLADCRAALACIRDRQAGRVCSRPPP